MQFQGKRFVLGSTILGLVFAVAACGNLADKAIETAIEKSADSDVDIDLNSKDGNLTFKTDDGEMSFNTGGDLPKDLPKEIPLPKVGTLAGSTTMPGMWALQYTGVSKSDFEAMKSKLEAAGANSEFESSMGELEQATFSLNDYMIQVLWVQGSDKSDHGLNYTISAKDN